MKKSFVKLVATSAVALTLSGAAVSVFAESTETTEFDMEKVQLSRESAKGYDKTNPFGNKFGEKGTESSSAQNPFGNKRSEGLPEKSKAEKSEGYDPEDPFGTRGKEDVLGKKSSDPKDPFGADEKVKKDAPVNAFENVGRSFKTLKEAYDAYPNGFVMYDAKTGEYVVYTDKGSLKAYYFNNLQDALNAFPNKEPMFENGKYVVYAEQNPRLEYRFKSMAEAKDAFPTLNPMADGNEYVVYTNEMPRLVHEFNSYEEAMAAFPGSAPMAQNGKYYVFTTYEKIAGTAGKVLNPTEGKLQDTNKKLVQEGNKVTEAEEKPAAKPAAKDGKKAELPQTGEASTFAIAGAAVLSALAGLGFVAKKEN
ncbi:LPXTG cell wall anchor domain-containing protein [Facklamia hominis]|uniref:LPXTG cell wall anchor domain-containing protein n=1 Tax=Facklamia hominis TaxID=178214 RepID=UPI0003533E80|nr:LPXTG cell wall anchor domain-containing protein [Facklamia hominis]EPH11792.1 LPXTG-domain-containing protein cell wall anchor domain [Facklamia hominis ACS-120-V-Sch10]